MTPQETKQAAIEAYETAKTVKALQVCKAIAQGDYFIGYPATEDPVWQGDLTRRLSQAGRCNKCGVMIARGQRAVWIKGQGVWHIPCYDKTV